MSKVQASIKDGKIVISLDGYECPIKHFAEFACINEATVHKAKKTKTLEKFNLWLEDRVWLKERGLAKRKNMAVFTIGDEKYVIKDIVDVIGSSEGYAADRLRQYQKGKITKAELFKPVDKNMSKRQATDPVPKIDWSNVGPRMSVDDVPNPGSWELENL